ASSLRACCWKAAVSTGILHGRLPVAAKIALAIDAERPDCIVLHGRGHMLRKQAGRASGCDPHRSGFDEPAAIMVDFFGLPDRGHCPISSSLEAGHMVYPPPSRNRKCRLSRDSML